MKWNGSRCRGQLSLNFKVKKTFQAEKTHWFEVEKICPRQLTSGLKSVVYLLFSRSILYKWVQSNIDWTMHHFPALKSPIRAARVARQNDDQSLVSDWLIPLCSGPGFESKRLKYATKTMDSFDATAPHETVCCLVEDERNHSSAFYSLAQNRTEFLKLILKHERNWQVFVQI